MNNLAKRTLFGLLFLVVMVFCITFDRVPFFLLFALIILNGQRELFKMSMGEEMKIQRGLAQICALAAFSAIFVLKCLPEAPGAYVTLFEGLSFLCLLLIPVSCIFMPDHSGFGKLAYIYAALLYVALPVSLTPFIVMDGEVFDGWMFLSLFIVIWVSDVGAYCIGTAFGQKPNSRKLAPAISPKKSWWGFWGAVLLGTGAAIGLHYLTWLPFSLGHCIALGVIISSGAVCGDLVESLWKRNFNVKDSGNAIPGHGGVLDRFDSSLVAIPLACIYLSLFGLI